MRLFGIQPDGHMYEFMDVFIQNNLMESDLEGWLESNPDGVLREGKLLLVGRQVVTNLDGYIDLLGIDKEGDVVVIELKKGKTPRETIAQSLEYTSFIHSLKAEDLEHLLQSYQQDESLNLADYHRRYFELLPEDSVSFNKDQHIIIVGQKISQEIKQTAIYLNGKGIRVSCVEFVYFENKENIKLLTQEIVVDGKIKVTSPLETGSLPISNEKDFFNNLNDNGKDVFSHIFEYAKEKSLRVRWGTKGFSLNTQIHDKLYPICYAYPVNCVFKQSIYSPFGGKGSLKYKAQLSEEEINFLRMKTEATNLFIPAGQDFKCLIHRPFSEQEIKDLIQWIELVEQTIRKIVIVNS